MNYYLLLIGLYKFEKIPKPAQDAQVIPCHQMFQKESKRLFRTNPEHKHFTSGSLIENGIFRNSNALDLHNLLFLKCLIFLLQI